MKTISSLLVCLILVVASLSFAAAPPAATPTPEPTATLTPEPTATPTPEPTPPWIQSTEKVVGAGHPTLQDVVNRPTQWIWNKFLTTHFASGQHRSPLRLGTLLLRDSAGELQVSKDNGVSWLTVALVTATPTPEPTVTPSPEPTATPTVEPTATPTPNGTPTATPTPDPVVLLIHSNTTNGSTTFVDSSSFQRTITPAGSVSHSTSQHGLGASSIAFNGSTDYLTIPNSSDWNFGAGDFTIEARVYLTSPTNDMFITYCDTDSGGSVGGWMFRLTSGNLGFYVFTDSWHPIGNTVTVSAATWHHIAVVSHNGTITVYLDGTAAGTGSWGTIVQNGSGVPVRIGAVFTTPTALFSGYMEEIRMTKDARWTADFTPPTEMY